MCYLSELLLGVLYVQVCVHLSELLLGVLHTQACCVLLYLCVFICADIYALSLYVKTLNTVTSLFRWICYTAYMYIHCIIRASVDALCRDGAEMRGGAHKLKSFQTPRIRSY